MVAESLLWLGFLAWIIQSIGSIVWWWWFRKPPERKIKEDKDVDSWNVIRDCVSMMPMFSGKVTDISLNEFMVIFEKHTGKLGPQWESAKLSLLKSKLSGEASECVKAASTFGESVRILQTFFASEEAIEGKVKQLARGLPSVRNQFDSQNLQKWANFAVQAKSWITPLSKKDQEKLLKDILLKNQYKIGLNSYISRNLWRNRDSIDNIIEWLQEEVKETRGAMLEPEQVYPVNKMQNTPRGKENRGPMCFRCGQFGHMQWNCPLPWTAPANAPNVQTNLPESAIKSGKQYAWRNWGKRTKSNWRASPRVNERPFEFVASIDNKKLTMMKDDGSAKNILPRAVFPEESGNTQWFVGAFGQKSVGVGPIVKEVHAGGAVLPAEFYVADVDQPLVGRNFTNRYELSTDPRGGVYAKKDGKQLVLQKPTLPDEGDKQTAHDDLPESSFSLDPSLGPEQVLLKPVITDSSLVPSTTQFGSDLFCIWTDEDLVELELSETSQPKTSYTEELKPILSKYEHLFKGFGCCRIVEHHIPLLGDPNPIIIPERRFPALLMETARQQILELLEAGIIRKSTSEWGFPIVPVRKKDGSLRLAIDYRKLNQITKGSAYPMARVDILVEKLVGGVVFSKLDLTKGYYQIKLAEEDMSKTAFRFDGELYEFTRMPFGLCSAPQTFQRAMNLALKNTSNAACYMDDVLIFSKTIEEHKQHLEEVFKALEKADLRMNPDKCKFGLTEIEFLGVRVNADGIRPAEEKIQAMRNMSQPKNKDELGSFLGLANHYQEYIPMYAHLANPLYQLKKKDAKFIWSESCEKAFQEIKEKLYQAPILKIPDMSKPFIVQTDASDVAMGAVLLQESDGKRHVIAYASQKFSKSELNYSTTEKEAYAVYWALSKRFRHYLFFGQFILETDHKALKFLKESVKSSSNTRLLKWSLCLAEFSPFIINHIPGADNYGADAMSRLIARIDLVDDELERRARRNPRSYLREGDRWYFIGDGRKRVAIPLAMRDQVLRDVHDKGGHMGFDRTWEMIQKRFHWPGHRKYTQYYVSQLCHTCRTQKRAHLNTAPLAPTDLSIMQPLSHWQIDILGPIPENPKYWIVVLQDRLTKWIDAKCIDSPNARNVINWLEEDIFPNLGRPSEIATDQGANFASAEFKEFLASAGCHHHETTAYWKPSLGMVERLNGTLEEWLRTNNTPGETWAQTLPRVLQNYRTSQHSVTGYSPYELIYGRRPTLPVDQKYEVETSSEETWAEMITKAKQRCERAAQRMEAQYNSRNNVKPVNNLDGQRVYEKNNISNQQQKNKPRFLGPFLARATENILIYELEGSNRQTRKAHASTLLPCADTSVPLAPIRHRGRPRRAGN